MSFVVHLKRNGKRHDFQANKVTSENLRRVFKVCLVHKSSIELTT